MTKKAPVVSADEICPFTEIGSVVADPPEKPLTKRAAESVLKQELVRSVTDANVDMVKLYINMGVPVDIIVGLHDLPNDVKFYNKTRRLLSFAIAWALDYRMVSERKIRLTIVNLLISVSKKINNTDTLEGTFLTWFAQWSAAHMTVDHDVNLTIRWLTAAGCDPNKPDAEGERPLDHVLKGMPVTGARPSPKQVAKALIKAGADPSMLYSDGAPLVFKLLAHLSPRDHLLLQRCIRQGMDVNIAHQHTGATVLMQAIVLKLKEMVKLLLEQKADVTLRNRLDGMTAMHYAAVSGDRRLVSLLQDYDADVNAQDYNGHTALHMAVCRHDHIMVAWLLGELQVETEIYDSTQRTALGHLVQTARLSPSPAFELMVVMIAFNANLLYHKAGKDYKLFDLEAKEATGWSNDWAPMTFKFKHSEYVELGKRWHAVVLAPEWKTAECSQIREMRLITAAQGVFNVGSNVQT